jgi:hypothetical protein
MNDNETNVEALGCATRLDIPPNRILTAALAAGLSDVLVIGWDEDGTLYTASSMASGPEALWLLELCRKDLLRIGSNEPRHMDVD